MVAHIKAREWAEKNSLSSLIVDVIYHWILCHSTRKLVTRTKIRSSRWASASLAYSRRVWQNRSMANVIKLYSRVEAELISQGGEVERLTLEIVEEERADFQAGFLSLNTPLARTLLGKPAGVSVPYKVGDLVAVRILSISAGQGSDENPAEKRSAATSEAMSQMQFMNAVNFAASTDTKWGEYDADGLDFEKWNEKKSDH